MEIDIHDKNEPGSGQKELAAKMPFRQPTNGRPTVLASADHKNAIAPVKSVSDYSLASAAATQLAEPLKTAKGDCASLVSGLQQLGVLANRQPSRIAVSAKGKFFFIELADIMAVHAAGNYASLKFRSSGYLLRESLSSIAVKLNPYGFVRIHRSVLVNASLVDEVWRLPTGEYRLRVRNGKEYVVTRRYKDNLRYLADVWLGPARFCGSAPAEMISLVSTSFGTS